MTFTYNWLNNQKDVALDPKERDQSTEPRTRDMAIGVQDKKYFAQYEKERKSQMSAIMESIKSMDKDSYRKSVINDIEKSM